MEETKVSLKLIGIHDFVFQCLGTLPKELAKDFKQENIFVNISTNVETTVSENSLSVLVTTQHLYKHENKEEIFSHYEGLIQFEIENLGAYLQEQEGKPPKVNEQLGVTVVSLAISTVRGILREKLKGNSILHGNIIPLVNPQDIAEKFR
ncbi:MAG: hypothetical protein ACI85I_000323 [Arenicella sp.]|jgi:hypothetical protein